MVSNFEIKLRARKTLGFKIFSNYWLYPLLASLIISFISSAISTMFIGALAVGILEIGISKYHLNISRRNTLNNNLTPLLHGIKEDVVGNFILGLLILLFVFLWSLLLVVPGIIKSYSYSMAYFIKCDHPEYSATQAIDESRRIMHGNKMKLLTLDLSFIGWWILGSLCFGVGTLWVAPYVKTAHAEFYLDLLEENEEQVVMPDDYVCGFIDYE